jgi:hypothetical protein
LTIFCTKSRQGVSKNKEKHHQLFFHARDALHMHKASPASLQASLAGLALNRWLAYSPAVVPEIVFNSNGTHKPDSDRRSYMPVVLQTS